VKADATVSTVDGKVADAEAEAAISRAICREFDGSDGTRTRDLRRDTPVMAHPG
jgi:hypothetical protein